MTDRMTDEDLKKSALAGGIILTGLYMFLRIQNSLRFCVLSKGGKQGLCASSVSEVVRNGLVYFRTFDVLDSDEGMVVLKVRRGRVQWAASRSILDSV